MRIKSINVKDFKRFTDLTVSGIPTETRLIVLAGPNGCGKSSFFDALHVWHQQQSHRGTSWEDDYHRKLAPQVATQFQGNEISIELHHEQPSDIDDLKKMFYIRSAYRNEAEFTVSNIRRMGNPLDVFPVQRMIDADASVSRNYQRLVGDGVSDLYGGAPAETTFGEYRDLAVNRIGEHLQAVFPDLALNTLSNPFDDGTFRFTKGTSQGYSYKNLSGGEKAVFDLLCDFIMAVRHFNDTVFCIDEPELHLNTRLQASLMRVLYDLLPEHCQLILATHSIGMMRSALEISRSKPEEVTFIDFGGQDFDSQVSIEPAVPTRAFWNRQYEVALDDLAVLVAPKRIVICEGEPGSPSSGGNVAFDARCYENIFDMAFPDTRFISMGGASQVEDDQSKLGQALKTLVKGVDVLYLVDRDNRTSEEVDDLRVRGVRVLSRRTIESYLLDDEVLRALCVQEGQAEQSEVLVAKKREILGSDFNDRTSNIKARASDIFKACESLLSLEQRGSGARSFMRDTLAPLIKPGMATYEELKKDIFG